MYKIYKHDKDFKTESGIAISNLEIQYTTLGNLNKNGNNVVWILHALTGNSNPLQWWGGLIGKGKLFDPENYYIICSNNLGSCYGTTGPLSINSDTGRKFGNNFPLITIRDMMKVQEILRKNLKIKKIQILIGGSMGGQICLEWAISKPFLFECIIPISTNAKHSAWGIAFNETQRMVLKNRKGLIVARAIAMLSYRCYKIYEKTQKDNLSKIDNFSASSYQRYLGAKLEKRFDVNSYYCLSKAMDSHNVGRKRGGIEKALNKISAKTLVIGIKSDLLFPINEQHVIAENIKKAKLKIIDSIYGHDGFLIEYKKISKLINNFIKNK